MQPNHFRDMYTCLVNDLCMEQQSTIDGMTRLFKQNADIDLLVGKRPMVPVTVTWAASTVCIVSQPWKEYIRVYQNLEPVP
jgi:hypothetical protein